MVLAHPSDACAYVDRIKPGMIHAQMGMGLGLIEFTSMLSVVLTVHEGHRTKSRNGRSWLKIAGEAWGTDILRERRGRQDQGHGLRGTDRSSDFGRRFRDLLRCS